MVGGGLGFGMLGSFYLEFLVEAAQCHRHLCHTNTSKTGAKHLAAFKAFFVFWTFLRFSPLVLSASSCHHLPSVPVSGHPCQTATIRGVWLTVSLASCSPAFSYG